ncbi:MAG TPA: SDR family NAD(P)-dependent oxidoreductase, partial [Steroidobacteraceae bacterium]|nr:SDR family NAD(P)-dependent oxidoreductase [Steroidobacteraceae bacterium]
MALVTGASRGIGRVIAMQLAQRGARVAVHYRNNRDAAEECLQGLAGSGHGVFAADLSDPKSALLLWQRVVEQLGAVDVLVNNAGLYIENSPLKIDYA